MNKIAIIVAGGSGTRMQTDIPKQFLPLCGQPVLLHTVEAFIATYQAIQIILVLPKDQQAYGRELLKDKSYTKQIQIVEGGSTRFASVQNGLKAINADNAQQATVFVHDGVRCLVTPTLIRRCYDMALKTGSAIPACPATDSMRMIDKAHPTSSQAVDRENIRLVQTPQTFTYALLKKGFEQPYQDHFTDEASVLESIGERVSLVEGDPENIKITRPIDLIIAAAILQQRKNQA